MPADWSFNDAPDTPVLTTRQVVEDRCPVSFVVHDADDGSWQFLTSQGGFSPDDAVVLTLGEMVALAPDLAALADLAPGWIAVRPEPGVPWQRCRQADWDARPNAGALTG